MDFMEMDLEQIIYESPRDLLKKRNLHLSGLIKRQLRIGNYGVADIVTFDRTSTISGDRYLDITVFELKKDKIGISAFLQAIRYCRGIQEYLYKREFYYFVLNIVLIGSKADTDGSFIFLTDLFTSNINPEFGYIESINFFTYKYKIDGIYFNQEYGYSLIDEGFKI